jgi:hypothetical protein
MRNPNVVTAAKTKIALLDTDAMSFLLKKNSLLTSHGKLNRLGWRVCFHPLNDFELLGKADLRGEYLRLMRIEKTKYSYKSKYFVLPLPPDKLFERERRGRVADWYSEFRPPQRDFLAETQDGRRAVDSDLEQFHAVAFPAATRDKQRGTAKDIRKIVERGVVEILQEAGVISASDPYAYPSHFSHLYALHAKYYDHKNTTKNDLRDWYLFTEFPYADVFVADGHNAEIAKKIRQAFLNSRRALSTKICRSGDFQRWCQEGGSLSFL